MNADNALKCLGKAVREKRLDLKYSQEALAEAAGLHRNYVGGVERGERNVGFKNLVALASALEMSASDLIRLAEKGKPDGP